MKHSPIALALSLWCCALLGSSCDTDHASAATRAPAEDEPTSVTVFGERVLLFMEHPHLVRGESARFLAHFSVLATGEPVRSGRVTLSIGSTELAAESPKRDGLFVPEGSVPESGRFAARLRVESEQAIEELDLGEIEVHADANSARSAAESADVGEPAGAVPFLMEQQWRLKLLLARAAPQTLVRRLVVPAQVETPEGAEASVSSPVAGRLVHHGDAALPRTGDVVEAGQALAAVEPPLGAAEIAELQALRLELDLRALDVARALSEAQARVDYSRRERERIVELREHGLSTRQELDLAERDLRVAHSDLEAALATKRSLDQLSERRATQGADASGLAIRLAVVSPLRGTVVTAPRLHGASIGPGEELFRVLDTSRVWIVGRVFEFDLHRLGGEPSAVATFAALPGTRIEVGGSRPLRLLPELDADSRTARLRCEVPNPDGSLKAGMLAELEIATDAVAAEVVVPRDAIVMDRGMPTAYVMLEGELFEKRDLELGVREGERVQVLRGIRAGERVATRGAWVIQLASLSPASFGAGHQH